MSEFRYFPNFPEEARFSMEPCYFCGQVPALDGIWLEFAEDFDDPPSVCVSDLMVGKAQVAVPGWASAALAHAVSVQHSDWSPEQQDAYIQARTDELAHTPPVPWIQENEWPICRDDYSVYIGQLTQEKLVQRYGSTDDAKTSLLKRVQQLRPAWNLASSERDEWWDSLGGFLHIYVFRCGTEEVYVLQTM